MSRAHLDYSVRSSVQREGFDPDIPIAGWYRARLRSGAVFVGVHIWHGLPLDPVTGEEMDRAPRWNATANGAPIDLALVWPKCAADPIDEAEHEFLIRRQTWAETHQPNTPLANPLQRADPLQSPILF